MQAHTDRPRMSYTQMHRSARQAEVSREELQNRGDVAHMLWHRPEGSGHSVRPTWSGQASCKGDLNLGRWEGWGRHWVWALPFSRIPGKAQGRGQPAVPQ